jgi:hypothetical protein
MDGRIRLDQLAGHRLVEEDEKAKGLVGVSPRRGGPQGIFDVGFFKVGDLQRL